MKLSLPHCITVGEELKPAGEVTGHRGWPCGSLGDREMNCHEGSDQISSASFPFSSANAAASLCLLPSWSFSSQGRQEGEGRNKGQARSLERHCSSDLLAVLSVCVWGGGGSILLAASLLGHSESTAETLPGDSEVDQYS